MMTPTCNYGADLQITAQRTASEFDNHDTEHLFKQFASCARYSHDVVRKDIAVEPSSFDQVLILAVVGYDGNPLPWFNRQCFESHS
jgi:hypothetical protein